MRPLHPCIMQKSRLLFCTGSRSSMHLPRGGYKRRGLRSHSRRLLFKEPEAESHLHPLPFCRFFVLFCLPLSASTSVCLPHIKKTLKVATATKVIPWELIKFACAQPRKERGKTKKSKSTPDHKRPKINGLLRRLWDGDARVSSREREEGKTTTAPHCPSCSFTFSSFEFDPTLFCGSSLGPLASSRKKVGKRGSREVVAAAPTLWASTLKTCRELFDQVQKTRWQIEGLGALREDSLVRTRQTFYVTFLSEFVMWKLQCVTINLLLAEEKKSHFIYWTSWEASLCHRVARCWRHASWTWCNVDVHRSRCKTAPLTKCWRSRSAATNTVFCRLDSPS